MYTVNFIVEGEVVSTQEVKHGEDAQAPQDPELEGATFKEWDKDYKNVKKKKDAEILLPGELEWHSTKDRMANGIPISAADLKKLNDYADQIGIEHLA